MPVAQPDCPPRVRSGWSAGQKVQSWRIGPVREATDTGVGAEGPSDPEDGAGWQCALPGTGVGPGFAGGTRVNSLKLASSCLLKLFLSRQAQKGTDELPAPDRRKVPKGDC